MSCLVCGRFCIGLSHYTCVKNLLNERNKLYIENFWHGPKLCIDRWTYEEKEARLKAAEELLSQALVLLGQGRRTRQLSGLVAQFLGVPTPPLPKRDQPLEVPNMDHLDLSPLTAKRCRKCCATCLANEGNAKRNIIGYLQCHKVHCTESECEIHGTVPQV